MFILCRFTDGFNHKGMQDFIDSGIGDYDNPDFKKLVARLKSIGVEFPYKPAMDNTGRE